MNATSNSGTMSNGTSNNKGKSTAPVRGSTAAFHPELGNVQRWAIMIVFVAAAAVSILGQLTMTASLPSIMSDFGLVANQGQWLTTGYMLALGMMIPCSGFFMTRFQLRHLYLVANAVFLVGIFGTVASNFPMLLAIRCLQGLAAGLLIPMMQVMAFRLFPPHNRGFAMGVAAIAMVAGPAAGPIIAGLCTEFWGWRSVFLVVALFSIALLLCYPIARGLRETTEHAEFDVPSAVLIALSFTGLTMGLSNLVASSVFLMLTTGVLPLLLGVLFMVLFARRQFALEQPLIDLRPFRNAKFALCSVSVMVVFGTLVNTEVLVCLYLQSDQGLSPLGAGLSLLSGTILSGALGPIAGRVLDRRGPMGLTIVGFAMLVGAGIMFSLVHADTGLWYSVLAFSIRGAGNALVMQNLQTWSINALPPAQITHATAIANTMRQEGGGLINTALFAVMSVIVAGGSTEMAGIQGAFALATAMLLVSGVATIVFIARGRSQAGQRAAVRRF